VGRDDDTEVTAFTDGCPGLRTILTNAGITKPPILDWFHIAMRLQHTKLAAASLSIDDPDRVTAKAVVVAEVERLRWCIWNGKAKNAQRSIRTVPCDPAHQIAINSFCYAATQHNLYSRATHCRGVGQVPCRRHKIRERIMIKVFLGVAAILTLTIETAMAEEPQVMQRIQVGSTHTDIHGSDKIRNRVQFAARDGAYPQTAIGAQPTQPAALDQEPESIGQGTEP
jgi:hypothetical protein